MFVHPSVCPFICWSHPSWNHAKVPFLTKTTSRTSENASYAVYPALLKLLMAWFERIWFSLQQQRFNNSLLHFKNNFAVKNFVLAWGKHIWFPPQWKIISMIFSYISRITLLQKTTKVAHILWRGKNITTKKREKERGQKKETKQNFDGGKSISWEKRKWISIY